MFTGIIRHIGKIVKIDNTTIAESRNHPRLTELTISCPAVASKRRKGDSISIDGVCLTITKTNHDSFTVQIIPETLSRTIISTYQLYQTVNIETPLKLQDELHGHLVLGHVDFVGTVTSIQKDKSSKTLQISFPLNQANYLAFKGSVTVNGVSLTISLLNHDSFEVSLIPATLASTNLNNLKIGSPVNIEIDMIARYLDSLLKEKAKESTYSFLKERNLI